MIYTVHLFGLSTKLTGGYPRPTCQNQHVDAPNEAPEPADQHERDCEQLHQTDHDVHTEGDQHVILFTVNPRLSTAEYTEPAQHGAWEKHGYACTGLIMKQ